MPDDVVNKICRQIAEEIVESVADFEDHEELKERDIQCTTDILLTKTSVPKMVEVLQRIAEKDTKSPKFQYGEPSSQKAQVSVWYQEQFEEVVKKAQQTFTILQGDKPVEESDEPK